MNGQHSATFIEIMHAAESLGIAAKSAYDEIVVCAEDIKPASQLLVLSLAAEALANRIGALHDAIQDARISESNAQ